MSDDRLTPEERAVIEAATEWRRANLDGRSLADAIDDYEASLRPQPVECLMTRYPGYADRPNGWWGAHSINANLNGFGDLPDREVWRVTITPIEQVR